MHLVINEVKLDMNIYSHSDVVKFNILQARSRFRSKIDDLQHIKSKAIEGTTHFSAE